MLADLFGACREVEHNLHTCQCECVAGRNGCPDVLAYLYSELNSVGSTEYLACRCNQHGLPGVVYLCRTKVARRCKPPLFVELCIVRKVGLWYYSDYLSVLYHCCTVEQQRTHTHRNADNGNDVELTGKVEQHHHSVLRVVEQQLLSEQVLACIACNAELREDDYLNPLPFCSYYLLFNSVKIELSVGYPYLRNCRSHFDKSVFHSF